jgi:putative membrane protein
MEQIKEKGVADKKVSNDQRSREHLANERTLLAWVRTSIGIMAFGFVVVKFSLFLKQLSSLFQKEVIVQQHSYSSVIGILLVAVGAVVLLLAFLKYKQTEKQLDNESFKSSSTLVLSLTIVMFLISMILILYLIESTNMY